MRANYKSRIGARARHPRRQLRYIIVNKELIIHGQMRSPDASGHQELLLRSTVLQ